MWVPGIEHWFSGLVTSAMTSLAVLLVLRYIIFKLLYILMTEISLSHCLDGKKSLPLTYWVRQELGSHLKAHTHVN